MNTNQVIVVGKVTMICMKGNKPFLIVNTNGTEVRFDFNFTEDEAKKAMLNLKAGNTVGVKGEIRWDGSANGYYFEGQEVAFIPEKQEGDDLVS